MCLQVAIAFYLLWNQLGLAAIASLGLLLMIVPLNILAGQQINKYQRKNMALKDERVKMMNEVLNGIKVLKLYAWEPSFQVGGLVILSPGKLVILVAIGD